MDSVEIGATISGTTFSVHCKFVSWHAREGVEVTCRELNKGDPPVSSNPHCNTVIESVNTIKYGTRGSELLSIVQLLLTNILILYRIVVEIM